VRFGGLVANDNIDLEVAPVGITGLIGPNGAGKTTLFNVLTGLNRPTSGSVAYDGQDISRWSPHRRARAGMSRTFQRLELFGGMTVRDNLLAAWEASIPGGVMGRRQSEGRQLVDEVIARLQLGAVAGRQTGELPTGIGRMVELGRALCTRPRLLLLDEPSSGLDAKETAHFKEILVEVTDPEQAVQSEDGRGAPAVLMVEHDVRLVMDVCRMITVLDFGKRIACGAPDEVRNDPAVIAAYLGEPAA